MANRQAKVKYVQRMSATPLIDDMTGKLLPANREINLHPSRAKYLQGMGMAYMPEEEPPQNRQRKTGKKNPRRPKGLTVIDQETSEDISESRAEDREMRG